MKIITLDEMKGICVDALQQMKWMDELMKIMSGKNYMMPVKTRLALHENDYFNVMPCMMPSINVGGLKLYLGIH